MSKLLNRLRTEYLTEYELKKYTTPSIYHGGKTFDLSKRWYVYYSFRDPSTGQMERQTPLYNNINKDFKTVASRMKALKILAASLLELLKSGYSPYENEEGESIYSSFSAIDFALVLKKESVNKKTFDDYQNKINVFKRYLKRKNLDSINIQDLRKSHIIDFLNEILIKNSPSTRNSYRRVISSIFGVLADNEYIQNNFVEKINVLKAAPERNKTYELQKVDEIYKYLEDNEPHLLLLVKFVSYNFLRPVEACRLQVKDLELNSKPPILRVRAKNKPVKTKIIPSIIVDELLKLNLSNPDHYLFTNKGVGPSELNEDKRRSYFTKKYKKKVKDQLKLDDDFTIYSFRHTFITKLYREFRKTMSETETHDKLRLITGHSTLQALQSYLRDIDAVLPEDYTKYLK